MSSPAPALGAGPPQPSDELWRIAGGQPDFDANGELCVIADRLYLASLASRPAPRPDAMFLTLSKKMQYAPFCADVKEWKNATLGSILYTRRSPSTGTYTL